TERRQLVSGFPYGDGAILESFEKCALRLERNAIDFIEQDDLCRGQRTEFRDELARRRIDHLKTDDFCRLQVRTSLETRELRVTDRGQNDAEERLSHARHAAQQEVAGVDLTLLVLVVSRRNLREQDDVCERFGGVVTDERLAAFFNNGVVELD